jgi:hypothetical protein
VHRVSPNFYFYSGSKNNKNGENSSMNKETLKEVKTKESLCENQAQRQIRKFYNSQIIEK